MSQVIPKEAPAKPKRVNQVKDEKNLDRQAPRTQSGWKQHLNSDTCIQVTAWLLFTAGLCVIASTIYMGIVLRSNDDEYNNNDYANLTEVFTTVQVPTTAPYLMLNKSVRAVNFLATDKFKNRGCIEYNCKVTCTKTESVYETFYSTCVNTRCPAFDTLVITEQRFPFGLLHNAWLDMKHPVYELVIKSSNILRIRSGAFNSPLFMDTYQLSLTDLQLIRIGGGALLGLKSLRYLIIVTPLKRINRAFFQPVQATLLHLRMNCGLVVPPGQTIFGVSTMTKLEYVDLSNNVFIGPLTREMFHATPNLHYLHISNSQITAINADAFEDLKESLQVVDLSGNLLTTISMNTLKTLLMGRKHALLSLAYNRWNCECYVQGFANIYRKFFERFLGTIYCHSPFRHYGHLLKEVNFQNDGCLPETTSFEDTTMESAALDTTAVTLETSEVSQAPVSKSITPSTIPTTTTFTITTSIKSPMGEPTYEISNSSGGLLQSLPDSSASSGRSSTEDLDVIQMRCLETMTESPSNEQRSTRDKRSIDIQIQSTGSTDSQEDIHVLSRSSEESIESEESDEIRLNPYPTPLVQRTSTQPSAITNRGVRNPSLTYYKFEVPSYTLELTLLANNSVKVAISDYDSQTEINIIWFSQQNEESPAVDNSDSAAAKDIDYHCEMYQQPYVIAEDLNANCTYTFCMLPPQHTISPFNCQPLHVPVTNDDSKKIWISNDQKQFTICMLCMIFTLSIFVGGIIAYFGVKSYPELLDGSKNVLVVKRSEPEPDYLKSFGSIKKEPLSRLSTKKISPSLPETPPASLPPPPPFSVTSFDLERLSSVKSSSTLFENSFGPPPFANDQYELPKQYNCTADEERCVPNIYAMSPCSPPPLPRRNTSITSSIVANRFSKVD